MGKKKEYSRKWFGKILHIFDPIYRMNFYFIRANTWEEYSKIFYKEFKIKEGVDPKDGKFSVVTHKDNIEIAVLWANDISILSHECMHAVFWVMNKKDIKLCYESEEAFCYLHDFLMNSILNKKIIL